MNRSARNDLIAGVVVLVLVAIFALRTGDIYVDPYDPGLSAQDFPIGVLVLATGLALALIGSALPAIARAGWQMREKGELDEVVRSVIPVILLGFLYIWLLEMFQYALPTIVAASGALLLFGNRGFARIAIASVVMTLAYYLVFYGILGLFEAPGTVWTYETQGFFEPIRRFLGLM